MVEIAAGIQFLKLCLWLSGGTIVAVQIIELGRAGMFASLFERVRYKLQLVPAIPLGKDRENKTVLGIARHGKTKAVMVTYAKMNEGVFFFNPQHEITPKGFVKADKRTDIQQMIKGIKKGDKINYLPSDDWDIASKEVGAIINSFFAAGEFKCQIIVDEVHLLYKMAKDKSGEKACMRLATTGLRWGFETTYISQRPANVNNDLLTQSTRHIIFALGKNDEGYLRSLHFPVDEITEKTKNEKYRFIVFDQKTVEGPYMVKI